MLTNALSNIEGLGRDETQIDVGQSGYVTAPIFQTNYIRRLVKLHFPYSYMEMNAAHPVLIN